MTKQEKINELTKKIEELTKKLNDVVNEPESKEVECYGDIIKDSQMYKSIYGTMEIVEGQFLGSLRDDLAKDFHNIYNRKHNLAPQANYQKIINRMWQLAYELNTKNFNWQERIDGGYKVHELTYNHGWRHYPISVFEDGFTPLPKFESKEAAQKAADDLNAKGYIL